MINVILNRLLGTHAQNPQFCMPAAPLTSGEAHMSSIFSPRHPKQQHKSTLTCADGTEINKKKQGWKRSGEMKRSMEGKKAGFTHICSPTR